MMDEVAVAGSAGRCPAVKRFVGTSNCFLPLWQDSEGQRRTDEIRIRCPDYVLAVRVSIGKRDAESLRAVLEERQEGERQQVEKASVPAWTNVRSAAYRHTEDLVKLPSSSAGGSQGRNRR
jgi:hypothetical protein